MATMAITFLVILLAMAGLALGVVLGRAPLRGSCGGVGCGACERCPNRGSRAGEAR